MTIGICGHKGSGKDYLGAILREYTPASYISGKILSAHISLGLNG